jgi:hypothetical protein
LEVVLVNWIMITVMTKKKICHWFRHY